MSLTQQQLAKRHEMIGASEIAAIVGLDPYKTALDVYAAKVLPNPQEPTSRFARWGLRLEAVVADAYAEALDLVVYLRQAIYERDGR